MVVSKSGVAGPWLRAGLSHVCPCCEKCREIVSTQRRPHLHRWEAESPQDGVRLLRYRVGERIAWSGRAIDHREVGCSVSARGCIGATLHPRRVLCARSAKRPCGWRRVPVQFREVNLEHHRFAGAAFFLSIRGLEETGKHCSLPPASVRTRPRKLNSSGSLQPLFLHTGRAKEGS